MDSLLNFYYFVREINLENGRNYKLDILRKYKDDEDIKYYLEYIYNPYKITGISTKKLNKTFYYDDLVFIDSFSSAKEMFNYILVNNTGTDDTIKRVKKFIMENCSQYEQEEALENLIEHIICKDLNLNVATLSINKIIPNLIPTFSVQLANKYFDKPECIEGKEFTLTTKLDGNRIIAIKDHGDVHFFTRQGKEYEGLIDLETELKNCPLDDICFDGELIADRVEGQDSKDQFQLTQKLARTKDKNKHGVRMRVFDVMTSQEFKAQSCLIDYKQRRVDLEEIFKRVKFEYFVKVPVLYQGNDPSVIIPILNEQIDNGEEGIMININSAPYRFDRSWDLVKVKRMQDLDLEVIGYEEGTGNFKGMLGAFLVRYKEGNTVKVGSGFEKEFRQEVWRNPQEYLGKVITVQYFEETKNQQGGLSLRFPVFITVRDDKQADY